MRVTLNIISQQGSLTDVVQGYVWRQAHMGTPMYVSSPDYGGYAAKEDIKIIDVGGAGVVYCIPEISERDMTFGMSEQRIEQYESRPYTPLP